MKIFFESEKGIEDQVSPKNLVARSTQMLEIIKLSKRVAWADCTVLIQGESGVGKGEIAKIIHSNSPRRNGPFVKVDCSTIPESLMESELFGYESGAFTGASKSGKLGMFEMADKGTIFLDEVGDLNPSLQPKLLSVLQDHSIMRVGGTKPIEVNVRVIAATNKDLKELLKKGLFREDLYYRLNVVPIYIPPLRERSDDIVPLIVYFRDRFIHKYNFTKKCSQESMHALINYKWPGNVRELENTMERIFVTAPTERVTLKDLPPPIISSEEFMFGENNNVIVNKISPLKTVIKEAEKQLLIKAMARHRTTRKIAEALCVSQPTVVRKLREHNIILDK